MKANKRLLALLLALVLVLAACSKPGQKETGKETAGESQGETAGETTAEIQDTTLVVGTAGELNGHYVAGMSNSSYDRWIRNLLWDYGTYATNEGGQFVLNTTVNANEPEVTENEDGSKTYKFTINEGLVWSDGQAITAKDFVFGALFSSSPSMAKVGVSGGFDQLVGYAEFKAGEAASFPGVKLVDEMSFEMTISAENVPYFYEVSAVSASPSPMHVWAPNLVIGEDGSSFAVAEGYELTDADKAAYEARVQKVIDELTAELAELEGAEAPDQEKIAAVKADIAAYEEDKATPEADVETLLDSAAYYVYQEEIFAPTVVSGAYTFLGLENQVVTVELNPLYAGDFRGNKPVIKRVEVRNVNENLDVDAVINGETDIVAGVIEGEKIEKAKAADNVTLVDYKRNGYGLIAFHVDMDPVSDVNVRQAVAWLMDRQDIVDGVLGGYGEVGQGMYGLSQWTYVAKGEEFLAAIEARGTAYTLNVDKANELLDQTAYKFEADGSTPWDAEKANQLAEADGDNFNYWRHNAEGKPLSINHAAGAETVGNAVKAQLVPNGRKAGMQYNVNLIDFNTLLENYYNLNKAKPEDRTYHAYTLATGFTPVFDPYYSLHSDWLGTQYNTNQISDPEFDRITVEMRSLEPTQTEEYLAKWLEFQLRYNEQLPNIPLYSNQYFDIYNNRITGLETTPDWDWSQDIADIRVR